MEQFTFIFVGLMAMAISAATLYTDLEDIFGGLVATVIWSIWALAATNVTVTTSGGTTTDSYTALAFFGAGMAGFSLLVMLTGAVSLLDTRAEGFIPDQER